MAPEPNWEAERKRLRFYGDMNTLLDYHDEEFGEKWASVVVLLRTLSKLLEHGWSKDVVRYLCDIYIDKVKHL